MSVINQKPNEGNKSSGSFYVSVFLSGISRCRNFAAIIEQEFIIPPSLNIWCLKDNSDVHSLISRCFSYLTLAVLPLNSFFMIFPLALIRYAHIYQTQHINAYT